MTDREQDDNFLSRWSRRKAQARRAAETPLTPAPPPAALKPPEPARIAATEAPAAAAAAADTRSSEPPPTLADVARLTPNSDFTRFVAADVDFDVKNAALKKLFADPHFNVMDGLDVYIDDYSRPDPIPASMLARIAQAQLLGSATRSEQSRAATGASDPGANESAPSRPRIDAPQPETIASDENADLQLQPHDAAGCSGVEPGADEDSGRERRRTG